MSKTWVLHTETKGTGAQMVPLEKTRKDPTSAIDPVFVPTPPARRPVPAPAPREPRRFRVVDVLSGEPLVAEADMRATVEALAGVRSCVDVRVYAWEPALDAWRLLTFAEQRLLWDRAQSTCSVN
jgi:hypothetical protein